MQANLPTFSTPLHVLRVDASARGEGSITRQLADLLLSELDERAPGLSVARRDLAAGLPFVDAAWVGANLAEPDMRDADQRQALSLSDELVAELSVADVLVIATPIYNFGVPASLKAWVDQDQVARARLTFRYTEHGPQGLLTGKKAYVLVATGGTEVGSAIDFATPWLKFVLGFLGITDVEVVAADRGMLRGDAARQSAVGHIARVLDRDWPALAEAV
ncbi:MAG: NAD(P)H-dependent oxidoreductase [Gammaproteobacteria bacterium]|nr:NAD(P)H-dependent oxidoreductase [Gammaproteobacteria bacterium]